ncbi:GbsR/MarR family transcriptional regulator [Streptomyces radicis]|nr:MarR family transcriptional regulator [Streptomyces radicis]
MINHDVPAQRPEEEAPQSPPFTEVMAQWVERFAGDLASAGMPRMPARIFSCLLVSEERSLSSAELAERLQVSPAAISGAKRYLEQMHLIGRESEPGSRRERYRLHHDVWYEAVANRDTLLTRWVSTMQAGLDAVGPESHAGARMAETAAFLAFLRDDLGSVLERWRAFRGESS